MITYTTVPLVEVKEINHPDNANVRVELVEAMREKYACIDIDAEIDRWLGVMTT